jgi:hypothetical protein
VEQLQARFVYVGEMKYVKHKRGCKRPRKPDQYQAKEGMVWSKVTLTSYDSRYCWMSAVFVQSAEQWQCRKDDTRAKIPMVSVLQ